MDLFVAAAASDFRTDRCTSDGHNSYCFANGILGWVGLAWLHAESPSFVFCTALFNIGTLCVPRVFCVDLRTICDYFPVQLQVMDWSFGAFVCVVKSICWVRLVCPSVRPSACMTSAPSGQIFVKFGRETCQTSVEKIQVC